jgi:hypothetical protein
MAHGADDGPGAAGNARGRLAGVRSAIEERLAADGNALVSIGDGNGAVVVRLAPGAAPLAAELKREFGDGVAVTVGFKPFPPGGARIAPFSLDSAEAGELAFALRLTCEMPDTAMPAGDSATGRLSVLNRGSATAEFSAAASAGWLCVPGTLTVVGGYSGAIAAGMRAIRLDAGASTALDFIVGTASCEPDDRYVVDAGTYEVVVPLSVWAAGGTRDPVRLLVRDCVVEVTRGDPAAS